MVFNGSQLYQLLSYSRPSGRLFFISAAFLSAALPCAICPSAELHTARGADTETYGQYHVEAIECDVSLYLSGSLILNL